MRKLEELIGKLSSLDDEPAIVAKLQEIGKVLITEYEIQVGDVTVMPLWVEAYSNNKPDESKKTLFNDPFVYQVSEQKHFNSLFFHHRTDDQRNGVDICLSLGNYYLSYLLKYTLVDGIVRSQSELSPLIRDKYDKKEGVLKPKNNSTDMISYTTRIGLSLKKEKDGEETFHLKKDYKDYKLAIVRDFDKMFITDFKFPHREDLVKTYLENSNDSKEEKAAFCKKVLNYCLSDYKDK